MCINVKNVLLIQLSSVHSKKNIVNFTKYLRNFWFKILGKLSRPIFIYAVFDTQLKQTGSCLLQTFWSSSYLATLLELQTNYKNIANYDYFFIFIFFCKIKNLK